MTIELILLMILSSILASVLYTVIGIIPGTDETSVLVPITALLVAFNINPAIILSFFISAMVSLNLTDSIPTALTSIPGGVMSTPLVAPSSYLKEKGQTTKSIKKMTMGSLIGTLVAIPVSLLIVFLVYLIKKYTNVSVEEYVTKYSGEIFFIGAIFLALLSKKKIVSLLAIIPFSLLISLIKSIHPISNTPFFLSITSGPLLASFFLMIFKKYRSSAFATGKKDIEIIEEDIKISFKDLTSKEELKKSILGSLLASITFFLSPVGMTLLIGETLGTNKENKEKEALLKVTVMNSAANSSYLSGIIISLLAFKFPISPAAIGPGSKLFDLESNVLGLGFKNSMIAIIIGVIIALGITVYLSLKYAPKMTSIVFKYISQESVLILLLSLVILLVYLDAGIIGILLIILTSVVSGLINKLGVTYGVQFMALYAAPFILTFI